MTNSILLNAVNKTTLSSLQKKFNQLKNRIVVLRNRLNETETTLEKGLHFFEVEIAPLKNALRITITEFIKSLYRYHKNPKRLSKKDKSFLREMIVVNCQDVLSLASSIKDIDLEVQEIFKEIGGIDCRDLYRGDLEEGKDMISKMCKDLNLDIDLDILDESDDQESILRKIFEAMAEAREKQEAENPQPNKPKSEREIQKELQAKELEKLQHEGIGKLYKQLARAIHPDLEQDPTMKAEKEELMKRLTTAYSNEDLHGLLSIEMEWFNRTESAECEGKLPSDEQLKFFNSLLKDQVKKLEDTIKMTCSHPRFFSLQMINLKDTARVLYELKNLRNGLKQDLQEYKAAVRDLTAPQGEKFLVYILRP